VACNTHLRRAFASEKIPWPVYFPHPRLSTDNAAMIAAAAYPKLLAGQTADLALAADASLSL
jgi:N6-L-threonylcarbamoyladenine synthase